MGHSTQSKSPSREDILLKLREHGVTPTQQRVDIGMVLFEKPQHLSADQVLSKVNESGPLVSKATVYNTLGLFARQGLVREVVVDPTRLLYDSNLDPHHHVLDVDTGDMHDVEVAGVHVHQLPPLPPGVEVEGIDVVIRIRHQS